jgi:isopenicillin-N epimerase
METPMNPLREHFYLEPEVIFLNHGSFGATPRPVLEVYQTWQRRLEAQPVRFLARESLEYFRDARGKLATYLHADPINLVFIPNATFGVNVVARSFDLQSGDEVLTSNHEYGACDNAWKFLAKKHGFQIVQQEIPLPSPSKGEIVDTLWAGVSEQTRLIFLSHITSSTAIRLPIEEICQRAREKDIPVLVDGAHAPGQINLNLQDLGADFYIGNCHKWMMAPKGAAFLHIQPQYQDFIQPLVVSWGWGENCPYQSDSRLQAILEWWGTKDPAAYFSVPAAIRFQAEHKWDEVRQNCQLILAEALTQIEELTGMPSIYHPNEDNFVQVGAGLLPGDSRPDELQSWLYENFRIEIPVIQWGDQWLIRPSVQGYNIPEDLDLLVQAMQKYLQEGRRFRKGDSESRPYR